MSSSETSSPTLLTARQVGKRLGVSVRRVHQLAKAGQLRPAIANPHLFLFTEAAVRAFEAERRGPGRPRNDENES